MAIFCVLRVNELAAVPEYSEYEVAPLTAGHESVTEVGEIELTASPVGGDGATAGLKTNAARLLGSPGVPRPVGPL